MAELRKNTYKYHRQALDTFEKTPEESRQIILTVLKNIKTVWQIYPNAIFVITFFDSKANELVNVFSEGGLNVRREVYDILTAVDPKRNIYQKIIATN